MNIKIFFSSVILFVLSLNTRIYGQNPSYDGLCYPQEFNACEKIKLDPEQYGCIHLDIVVNPKIRVSRYFTITKFCTLAMYTCRFFNGKFQILKNLRLNKCNSFNFSDSNIIIGPTWQKPCTNEQLNNDWKIIIQ